LTTLRSYIALRLQISWETRVTNARIYFCQ